MAVARKAHREDQQLLSLPMPRPFEGLTVPSSVGCKRYPFAFQHAPFRQQILPQSCPNPAGGEAELRSLRAWCKICDGRCAFWGAARTQLFFLIRGKKSSSYAGHPGLKQKPSLPSAPASDVYQVPHPGLLAGHED